jgi:hypothetical protein
VFAREKGKYLWNANDVFIHEFVGYPLVFGFFSCYIWPPLDKLVIRYLDDTLPMGLTKLHGDGFAQAAITDA